MLFYVGILVAFSIFREDGGDISSETATQFDRLHDVISHILVLFM
jgi:hypothetical protein